MPSDYCGACEICGALYFYVRRYVAKNWRKPEVLDDGHWIERLECDHIVSKHPTLYTEVERRRSQPTPLSGMLNTPPRRTYRDDD